MKPSPSSFTPPRLRGRAFAAIVLPTLALIAMLLIPPNALAEPEQVIKDNCEANGGIYATNSYTNSDGQLVTISSCCNKGRDGKLYCAMYKNGVYDGTVVNDSNQPPTGPTLQPVAPPPASAAPVMPGQGAQPVQPPPATGSPVIP